MPSLKTVANGMKSDIVNGMKSDIVKEKMT